jgi:tripartite-type tricarboxylate transporter receptor subunit TctC
MHTSLGRWIRVLAVLFTLTPVLGHTQSGDNFPVRPIRIWVPYGPGGATDITARLLAAKLPDAIGQQVLVENRPGAGGTIAVDALAAAAPDGYTLLVGNVSTNAINETTYAGSIRSKPSRDLVGVSNLTDIPHIVAVSGLFPAQSIKEAIDIAKAQPGKLNYSSVGGGTYPHLDMIKFARAAGIEMTHVPYKGGAGQILPALITNEVQITFINLSSALPHVRAGKIRAIALTTDARLPELPNVATMAEQGFAGHGTNAWQGLFAPAGTPKPVLDKLHAAVAKAMTSPDLKDTMAKQMLNLVISKSHEEFTDFMRAETRKWAEFVAQNPVKVD